MRLVDAYKTIWAGKMEGIQPPDQQHIDRVVWTEELFGDATGPLLDVGCGSGSMLARAKAHDWKTVGLDIDWTVAEWLRNAGYDAFCCNVDVGAWSLDDGAFGIATLCDVIEHVLDPAHVLSEAARVLVPGGHLYVGTPNCSYWERPLQLSRGSMFRTSGDNVLKDGGHIGYYGPGDLSDVIRGAGFCDVRIHYRNLSPPDPPIKVALETAGMWNGECNEYSYMIAEAVKP